MQTLYSTTGKRVGLVNAVGQFCEAAALLGDHPLTEAVEGFSRSVAVVRQKSISEAVEEFIKSRAPKAVAKEPGKRSALNPKYVENTAAWLRESAATFPWLNVCDLGKEQFLPPPENIPATYAEFLMLVVKAKDEAEATKRLRDFFRSELVPRYPGASPHPF